MDTENHLGLMWHYSLCSCKIIGNYNMPFCTPFPPRTFALLTLLRDQNGVQKSHPVVRKEDQIPLLLDITSHKKGQQHYNKVRKHFYLHHTAFVEPYSQLWRYKGTMTFNRQGITTNIEFRKCCQKLCRTAIKIPAHNEVGVGWWVSTSQMSNAPSLPGGGHGDPLV